MVTVAVNPGTQLIDLKTGLATRDLFLLLQTLTTAINQATSDYVTVDAVQTLTNKTVSGYTATTALAALLVLDAITDGVTNKAASSNAVFDAVATLNASIEVLTASVSTKQDAGGIVTLPSYTVAGVPDATVGAGQLIYVSNEAGGAVVAFSDATDWRRVTDRAVIS